MATEVFNRIGEAEIYSGNPNSYRKNRYRKEDDEFETSETTDESDKTDKTDETDKTDKIDFKSPVCDDKKEFFESLEKDSLTVDTCRIINHDWKKE